MQATKPLSGASRLPLISKQANKHYFKGNRQAVVPGSNQRTGRPGRFSNSKGSNFIIDDSKVRVFVAPPPQVLENTTLKPYVPASINPLAFKRSLPKVPPSSPVPLPSIQLEEYKQLPGFKTMKKEFPRRFNNLFNERLRKNEFVKEYRALSFAQREALKAEVRRKWWEGTQKQIIELQERENAAEPSA